MNQLQTTIFFVRHAESDISIKDEMSRPLTPKGLSDSRRVGTALSTIVHYFDPEFGFDHFWRMVGKMPYILAFQFDGTELKAIEEVELTI
ncbi:hypothetical protein COLU111180_20840 [Cohnella lubricantis]|uniref:Histidine phosphatase family protein n=1 Tax=Cohnella lubricantis TaxID=2163172 RepID=A0A841T8K0_9BACL|nr:hypothetical protein [Cohnella lubricantis]MBB6677833.1 hypothetical protein [Cohnella lubricantis]MBP2120491.1 broad specificity phosphatase PhoE [Cohnella lubricantis]